MLVNTWSTLIGSRCIKIGFWNSGMSQGEMDRLRSPVITIIIIIIMLLHNDGVIFRISPIFHGIWIKEDCGFLPCES